MSAFTAEVLDKMERVIEEKERYRLALLRIANQDFRGNRSTESQIAYRALNPEKDK